MQGETIMCEMTNNAVSFQRNVIVGTSYELQTNAIDTVNDNDLVFSRNNVQRMALDKFTEDTVEKLKQLYVANNYEQTPN